MTARHLMLVLLASPTDALALGSAMRTTVLARCSPPAMLWDPMKDEIADTPMNKHNHMLQHTEEAVPMYVPPGPSYKAPEDGCEEVSPATL